MPSPRSLLQIGLPQELGEQSHSAEEVATSRESMCASKRERDCEGGSSSELTLQRPGELLAVPDVGETENHLGIIFSSIVFVL